MCSKFTTDYNKINNSLNTLNYPIASNIASATDYKTTQACWIRQMNTRFLNNPHMHEYIQTKRDNNLYFPLNAKIPFQPYGTFMDFSQPVYQDARICDLRYTPSTGFKKINNQDLFILKNEKHNNAIIKSTLDDFIVIDKHY
jgi:hypothetical protein